MINPAGPFEAMAPIKQATAHNPTMPEKALITTMVVLEAVSMDEDISWAVVFVFVIVAVILSLPVSIINFYDLYFE